MTCPPRRQLSAPRGGGLDPVEQELFRRALDTFAELGYETASVRVLAQRLEVSHNFINARYGSKLAFWRLVVNFACQEEFGRPAPESVPASDDVGLLLRTVRDIAHRAVRNPQLNRLLIDEAAHESPRLEHLHQQFLTPALATVTPCVERLVAAGRISPIQVHTLYFAVIGSLSCLTQRPLARRLGYTDPACDAELAKHADMFADLIVSGLLSSAADIATVPGS